MFYRGYKTDLSSVLFETNFIKSMKTIEPIRYNSSRQFIINHDLMMITETLRSVRTLLNTKIIIEYQLVGIYFYNI